MGQKPLPTQAQFLLSTSLLLVLSFCLAPFSALACFIAWAHERLNRNGGIGHDGPQKTVLVNGAKMYKSLGIVRALGKAGCRVIVCESGTDGLFSATRFSKYVSKFYKLPVPTPGDEASLALYVNEMVSIAAKEDVDYFIPCSGAGTTVEDAKAAQYMSEQSSGRVQSFIASPDLTKVLHEKDLFMELCKSLGLPTPESHVVTDPNEALSLIKQSKFPMILKATAVLDDLGRSDMTNYPLAGDAAPYPKTLARLQKGLSVPMTEKTPYILQQFVLGSEWCTHATVKHGKLVAFVCCPSNDMLMRYEDHTNTEVGRKAEAWTEQFLSEWAKSERGQKETLQGHFSMDFILSDNGDLFPIECNPRIHTAICLLRLNPTFAHAYLSDSIEGIAKPPAGTKPCSWLGHDLPALFLAALLPATESVHPYWEGMQVNELKWDTHDPTFDPEDPLPFFGLYHVQWTWIMFKQLLWKRKKWVRINASTARVFECP